MSILQPLHMLKTNTWLWLMARTIQSRSSKGVYPPHFMANRFPLSELILTQPTHSLRSSSSRYPCNTWQFPSSVYPSQFHVRRVSRVVVSIDNSSTLDEHSHHGTGHEKTTTGMSILEEVHAHLPFMCGRTPELIYWSWVEWNRPKEE